MKNYTLVALISVVIIFLTGLLSTLWNLMDIPYGYYSLTLSIIGVFGLLSRAAQIALLIYFIKLLKIQSPAMRTPTLLAIMGLSIVVLISLLSLVLNMCIKEPLPTGVYQVLSLLDIAGWGLVIPFFVNLYKRIRS